MQRTRYPERRRTTRLSLQIPLTVRCRLPEGETIDLKASTYVVSANGALVLMDTPLIPGQKVRVINQMTSESAECFVTSLREKRERRFVGIGFANPNVDFWHIVFPKSGTRQAVRSSLGLVPPGFRQDNSPQFSRDFARHISNSVNCSSPRRSDRPSGKRSRRSRKHRTTAAASTARSVGVCRISPAMRGAA